MNEQVISAPLRRNETPALYTDTGRVLFNRPEHVALPDPPRVIALPRLGLGVRRSRQATRHDVGEMLERDAVGAARLEVVLTARSLADYW
jgi:hypothetical protein